MDSREKDGSIERHDQVLKLILILSLFLPAFPFVSPFGEMEGSKLNICGSLQCI